MTEKQLTEKLKELKSIKPDSDWVSLTKSQILKDQTSEKFGFLFFLDQLRGHKLAFSTLAVLVAFIGVFGFAQNSVPGGSLYSIKKMTERGQSFFVSEEDQSKHNLELANKRLTDLTKIAKDNDVNKLASAINEYKESVEKVVNELKEGEEKKIANELVKLEKKEEEVKSLGVEISHNEKLDNYLAEMVKREIEEMEAKDLTEEEKELLNSIKTDYEQGEYSKALESLLLK